MAVIRGTALTNFHQLVTELGGDSRALVTAAHIPYDDVGRHDRFLSLSNGARLLEDTAVALETPDFGRLLGRRQGIEILGPVGLAARNAATVADAFVMLDKFMAAYWVPRSAPASPPTPTPNCAASSSSTCSTPPRRKLRPSSCPSG